MKFVLAPDSFKGTMSATEAARTMAAGVRAVFPDAECVEIPMADGGEGTTQSLVNARNGQLCTVTVNDALGRPREAHFGWFAAERLAVVEVAEAVGIQHLSPAERDPRAATTRGVGELLAHLIELDPEEIIVGLGGSATNDGGWGMARELGAKAFDVAGHEISELPLELARAVKLDTSEIDQRWKNVRITLACDVDNPLTGPNGASAVFGPQKGLDDADVEVFDRALANWGALLDKHSGNPIAAEPGAGAAGGLGAAFMALFGGRARRGVDVVIDAVCLRDHLDGATAVFTGEGSLDFQTKFGKTPWGVMLTAREHGVPTIAFGGQLGNGAEELHDSGFAAIVPTVRNVASLEETLANARPALFESVRMACRILAIAHDNHYLKERS